MGGGGVNYVADPNGSHRDTSQLQDGRFFSPLSGIELMCMNPLDKGRFHDAVGYFADDLLCL